MTKDAPPDRDPCRPRCAAARKASGRALPLALGLAIAALAGACRGPATEPPERLGYRTFDCTLFDRHGDPAATGKLYLPELGWDDGSGYSNKFDGAWNIPKVTLDLNRLPFGQGELIGYIRGSQVRIDLNPQMAENNIMLTGRLKEDGQILSGKWMNAALGHGAQGTFKAVISPSG